MQRETGDVLEEFRRGSTDALETLFRLHQRSVYGWVLRIVRNPPAAEELTVETFWRLHRAHARFDPRMGFEGWARQIATHAALDWLRRTKADRSLRADLPESVAAPVGGDPAVSAEIRNRVAAAFGRLPAKLRATATLAVIEELPHKQIAESMGISTAAVKLRVFRALRLLRNDLEKQGIRP
jgi:RNA polymerase sigma factor (sigma-70 family)